MMYLKVARVGGDYAAVYEGTNRVVCYPLCRNGAREWVGKANASRRDYPELYSDQEKAGLDGLAPRRGQIDVG